MTWRAVFTGPFARGKWLYWSGAAAVWSFLDIAVVVLIALAFNATLGVDIPGLVTAEFFVAVSPCVGAYKFCAAVVLTALVGHLALTQHRSLSRDINGPEAGAYTRPLFSST